MFPTVKGTFGDPGLNQYFYSPGGLVIPKKYLTPSSSKATQVTSYQSPPLDIEQFYRMQIYQSRYQYFVYGKVYELDTWTRACIDYISRRMTREPNRLVDETDPDNPELEALEDFLEQCNDDSDFEEQYYGWAQDLLKYGQAYSYIETNRQGDPVALWPLDARITFPITDPHGTIKFHCQAFNGRYTFFDKDEVVFIHVNNNGSDPRALPGIRTLLDSIAMDLNASRYNAALFENNLSIGAIFTLGPGATDEEVQDNDRYLREKYSKPENAHRHLILRGDAKLLRDGAQATKDIDFDKLMASVRQRVCGVFGVPEFLLGIAGHVTRASGQIHELDTYVNTVRPYRRLINRQFTRQFLHNAWGANTVKLDEPLSSMLHTKEEIDAASEVANMGLTYNEWREMVGLPSVPQGDYYVMKIPGAGGLVRLDVSAMPGLGDPHFDPAAHEKVHMEQQQYEQELAQNYAKVGMQAPANPSQTPYVPPMPQYQTQLDPTAARIINVARSLLFEGTANQKLEPWEWVIARSIREGEEWIVERRDPNLPGARGGNFYRTPSGKVRYGKSPSGRNTPPGPGADGANNTLTNPKDPPLPQRLTDAERATMLQARMQVQTALRQIQAQNGTNEDFINVLNKEGWDTPAEATEPFNKVSDAQDAARVLSETYPTRAFVVLGADGQYFLMAKDLADISAQDIQTQTADVTIAPKTPPGKAPASYADGSQGTAGTQGVKGTSATSGTSKTSGTQGTVTRSLEETPSLSLLLQQFTSKVSNIQEQ